MTGVPMHVIQFGNSRLPYTVKESSNRRTVGIAVSKEHGIEVTTPPKLDAEQVATIVRRKGTWIRHQLRDLDQVDTPQAERQWKEGESFHYMGKHYRLRYQPGDDVEVRLKEGYLNVYCAVSKQESPEVARAVESWYRNRARAVFKERIPSFTAKLRVNEPTIHLRKQAKRWGSCTAKNEILLNWQLIAAPASIIDYVLAHEVVHLAEKGHGPKFKAMLRKLMPDCRVREERLMREGAGYVMFQ